MRAIERLCCTKTRQALGLNLPATGQLGNISGGRAVLRFANK